MRAAFNLGRNERKKEGEMTFDILASRNKRLDLGIRWKCYFQNNKTMYQCALWWYANQNNMVLHRFMCG